MTTSLPILITAIQNTINTNADEITELDKAIGDGDHVVNLQRGLNALSAISDELTTTDWSVALMKIGMTLMSTMGGASGSLFGSMFVSMGKAAKNKESDTASFAEIFSQGVEAVKLRGKADIGEKTMLDTLIPVAISLNSDVANNVSFDQILDNVANEAIKGMESTKDLIASKGRASFLGERAIGHIDAGARTSQLMICAIVDVLRQK
ncbi:MAG: dihydroxyacetone kinase subunit L [Gammaproteobacteria bacterium]|nr:MAG: dihydroxyacetone kinase subunit L [Gammaproteobacteria bacterium]